ncbi:MAG: DNA-binding protein [Deltaproteobacteria bacterium CG11_big_fil_rev_8_21_14_0_20_42_23]|nr:MAG: DNA-binding protein [Deltaproteobacteria bacterium CG11_big_fil_rev_8_21_14_0_20_42_23]PJC65052.1 MAG: DNA-binding protein [Deltaproteobacteria bacterium CG_4_9_14_0_2_um_filter_42_21]
MVIMDAKQAAEFLSIAPNTLRRLASEGHVPCKRIGTGSRPIYRFVKSKLEAWLTEEPPFVDPRRIKTGDKS